MTMLVNVLNMDLELKQRGKNVCSKPEIHSNLVCCDRVSLKNIWLILYISYFFQVKTISFKLLIKNSNEDGLLCQCYHVADQLADELIIYKNLIVN